MTLKEELEDYIAELKEGVENNLECGKGKTALILAEIYEHLENIIIDSEEINQQS